MKNETPAKFAEIDAASFRQVVQLYDPLGEMYQMSWQTACEVTRHLVFDDHLTIALNPHAASGRTAQPSAFDLEYVLADAGLLTATPDPEPLADIRAAASDEVMSWFGPPEQPNRKNLDCLTRYVDRVLLKDQHDMRPWIDWCWKRFPQVHPGPLFSREMIPHYSVAVGVKEDALQKLCSACEGRLLDEKFSDRELATRLYLIDAIRRSLFHEHAALRRKRQIKAHKIRADFRAYVCPESEDHCTYEVSRFQRQVSNIIVSAAFCEDGRTPVETLAERIKVYVSNVSAVRKFRLQAGDSRAASDPKIDSPDYDGRVVDFVRKVPNFQFSSKKCIARVERIAERWPDILVAVALAAGSIISLTGMVSFKDVAAATGPLSWIARGLGPLVSPDSLKNALLNFTSARPGRLRKLSHGGVGVLIGRYSRVPRS